MIRLFNPTTITTNGQHEHEHEHEREHEREWARLGRAGSSLPLKLLLDWLELNHHFSLLHMYVRTKADVIFPLTNQPGAAKANHSFLKVRNHYVAEAFYSAPTSSSKYYSASASSRQYANIA